MSLSPKPSPKSSLESSLKSPSPELNPAKRPTTNPSSSFPPAKKSRPNSPDEGAFSEDLKAKLREIGLTVQDLKLTPEERARKSWDYYFANEKEKPLTSPLVGNFDPSQPLPPGWAWSSWDPDDGRKLFACKMYCYKCGKSCAHMTMDCPDELTQDAIEFRKRARLQFDWEVKQEAEKEREAEEREAEKCRSV